MSPSVSVGHPFTGQTSVLAVWRTKFTVAHLELFCDSKVADNKHE